MLRALEFIESNQCHSFFSTHMSIKLYHSHEICNFLHSVVCFPTSCCDLVRIFPLKYETRKCISSVDSKLNKISFEVLINMTVISLGALDANISFQQYSRISTLLASSSSVSHTPTHCYWNMGLSYFMKCLPFVTESLHINIIFFLT